MNGQLRERIQNLGTEFGDVFHRAINSEALGLMPGLTAGQMLEGWIKTCFRTPAEQVAFIEHIVGRWSGAQVVDLVCRLSRPWQAAMFPILQEHCKSRHDLEMETALAICEAQDQIHQFDLRRAQKLATAGATADVNAASADAPVLEAVSTS